MASFLLHLCASAVVIVVNKSLPGVRRRRGDRGVWHHLSGGDALSDDRLGIESGHAAHRGYNYGARRYDRVLKVLRQTVVCAVCVTTTGFLLGQLFPRQVAMLFVDAADGAAAERMISTAAEGLRIVLCVFPIVGFQIVTSNFFQYIGKPHKAIFLLTRQMLFLSRCSLFCRRISVRWCLDVDADCRRYASLLAAVPCSSTRFVNSDTGPMRNGVSESFENIDYWLFR